jgi:hypothetical protein
VTNWQTGDTIPIAAGRSLRVVGIIATNENEPPVLIVEAWPKEGQLFRLISPYLEPSHLPPLVASCGRSAQ